LFEDYGRRGYVVAEPNWDKKSYCFSNYRHFLDFFCKYYHQIVTYSSLPNFNKHEVIHAGVEHRKVMFDIDMKNGSSELFQEIIDSLMEALQHILPDLDLEKEVVYCTSHGNNKFSAHIILLRFVSRANRDLQHLYGLVKEMMPEHLYAYIDPAFASFSHNLRLLGSTKEGRTKVYNPSWTFKNRVITTQLPEYYPDLDFELTKKETRFYNWFTLYEDETSISPLRMFCACSLVVCEGCKFINFNLPPEEPKKKIEKVEGLDLGSMLATKCPGYEEQFSISEDSSGFYKLERLCSGQLHLR